MTTTKIDMLLQSLLDIQKDLGSFRSDITTLFNRASEDRSEREREHRENQEAAGELRQSTAAAIAELRQSVIDPWKEMKKAVEALSAQMNEQSRKLDDHALAVATAQRDIGLLQIGRTRLVMLAGVGFAALWVIGRAVEAGLQWAVAHVLKMKFGG